MNVAEQLVAQLIDAGVHRVYGIVGDSQPRCRCNP